MRIALVLVLLASPLLAHTIEVPLVDLPYNAREGVRAPSMEQSLSLTSGFYELSHAALHDAFHERRWLERTTVAVFDLVTTVEVPLPLSSVWLHEEWHRAVMGNRGIDSFNDVYRFEIGAESIAVSHVEDEDLIRLKRDHPEELVRLNAAGMESELALVQRLQKDRFFRNTRGWHVPLYLLTKASVWGYVSSGTDDEVNRDTDESNAEDGADVERRDFTGHDFTAWVYDLHRPNEPYTARGLHPSGVGINRYRKPEHLTPEERDFLELQGRLSLINFLDSNLIGIDDFHATVAGRRIAFNVTASHVLTSFGYTIDANLFLRDATRRLFVVLHAYRNRERAFPGVEAELIDVPYTFRGRELTVTPRLALWLQPERQRFADSDASPGGLASMRVAWPLRGRYGTFVEAEAKTKGWVMGNVRLGSDIALRFGVMARM